jgi:hypothetical protein
MLHIGAVGNAVLVQAGHGRLTICRQAPAEQQLLRLMLCSTAVGTAPGCR